MHILICGLGNPGSQYLKNRHNIGFLAVEYIAEKFNAPFSESSKFSGWIASKKVGEITYIFCKPNTYMNLSGQCIGAIKRFYNIDNGNIWVIHDEIDLAFDDIRIKRGGGHAGHNGLKSIDAHIGKDYHRVRLGVGRPEHKDDVARYVLSDFAKSENYQELIENAWAQLKPIIIPEDLLDFISKY